MGFGTASVPRQRTMLGLGDLTLTILRAKLVGYLQCYGGSDNSRKIGKFYYLVLKLVFKRANRRSNKSSMTLTAFNEYLQRYD